VSLQPDSVLTPTVVSAFGRSGTTALMSWLATDPRVAIGDEYPYEHRYLTWLAKVAVLAGRPASSLSPIQLETWHHDGLGPPPWAVSALPLMPRRDDLLSALWQTFSVSVRVNRPRAALYAEKVAEWVEPVIRGVVTTRSIHLVRDPRDVFVSAAAFAQRTGAVGFGADAGTPLAQARHIAHRMLSYHENARADSNLPGSLTVRYEDMLRSPERVAERIRDALGIELAAKPPSLGPHDHDHRTSTSDESSIGRWRHDGLPSDVHGCLESVLHDLMTEHRYAAALPHAPLPSVVLPHCTPTSPDGALQPVGDRFVVKLSGGDFGVEPQLRASEIGRTHEVWACVRGDAGDHCSAYWRRHDQAYSEERVVHVPFRPGPHWQIVRLPLSSHPSWASGASALRLDLFNGRVTPGSRGEVRWIRLVS
jgi:hypothetical protein